MTIADENDIHRKLQDGAVLKALQIGSKRAVHLHKLLGHSVATFRNGKVVWIPPQEIQTDDVPAAPYSPRLAGGNTPQL